VLIEHVVVHLPGVHTETSAGADSAGSACEQNTRDVILIARTKVKINVPRRCFALARETHRSNNSCIRVFGSYPFSLHFPASMT